MIRMPREALNEKTTTAEKWDEKEKQKGKKRTVIQKIISGAQTGADLAAIYAATVWSYHLAAGNPKAEDDTA